MLQPHVPLQSRGICDVFWCRRRLLQCLNTKQFVDVAPKMLKYDVEYHALRFPGDRTLDEIGAVHVAQEDQP